MKNSTLAPRLSAPERTEALGSVSDLAWHIANRLCTGDNRHLIGDVAQEVMIGFAKSARAFDPTRGVKFITYCYRTGWRAGIDFLQSQLNDGVKIPRGVHRSVFPNVLKFWEIGGSDGTPFEQTIPDRDATEEPEANFWNIATNCLPPRLRRVVLWRFRDEQPLHAIASRLGVSRQRAQQLVTDAIDRMRQDPAVAENLFFKE